MKLRPGLCAPSRAKPDWLKMLRTATVAVLTILNNICSFFETLARELYICYYKNGFMECGFKTLEEAVKYITDNADKSDTVYFYERYDKSDNKWFVVANSLAYKQYYDTMIYTGDPKKFDFQLFMKQFTKYGEQFEIAQSNLKLIKNFIDRFNIQFGTKILDRLVDHNGNVVTDEYLRTTLKPLEWRVDE